MRLPAVALCFGLLAPAVALTAPLYSWTGADGQTHYSDQPPPQTHAKQIRADAAAADASDATAAKQAPASTANVDECQKQKDKLTAYTAASKITETDALGATREYSAEDRQKLLDVTQQKIAQSCN